MNSGIFYAYYTIALIYLTYRLHVAGLKGSELAKDYSHFTFTFIFALGGVAFGLLLFEDNPWMAAFVAKIIGFGFWYIANALMVPVFYKLTYPDKSPKPVTIAFLLFGIFLTIYHFSRLTPLYFTADGIPIWNIDPLVTVLQGSVSIALSLIIGVSFAIQAIKAKHPTRGFLLGGGHIAAALFTPLTYAVSGKEAFIAMNILSVLGFTMLILSVWSRIININELHYERVDASKSEAIN